MNTTARRPAQITFKAKPWNLHLADGSIHRCVTAKKKLTRTDCNLRPHEHRYYNSDMFIGMLMRAYRKAASLADYPGGRDYIDLDALPPHITADTSGFLTTITITLPDDFR